MLHKERFFRVHVVVTTSLLIAIIEQIALYMVDIHHPQNGVTESMTPFPVLMEPHLHEQHIKHRQVTIDTCLSRACLCFLARFSF